MDRSSFCKRQNVIFCRAITNAQAFPFITNGFRLNIFVSFLSDYLLETLSQLDGAHVSGHACHQVEPRCK